MTRPLVEILVAESVKGGRSHPLVAVNQSDIYDIVAEARKQITEDKE